MVGSFEVIGLLGVGGMGEVYRARDTRLKRDVAIKVLSDSVSQDPDRLALLVAKSQLCREDARDNWRSCDSAGIPYPPTGSLRH
jgi:serine/threonine protein kinase